MEQLPIQQVIEDKLNGQALKLYVYGSCESDQYYHPKAESQSKRPISLTDIPHFTIKAEDQNEKETKPDTIIVNPLIATHICKIACGALHSVVLTTDGKVFTFGCNDEGALGRESFSKIPLEVKLDQLVDLISAGDNHSMFANSISGSLYFTGTYKFLRGENIMQEAIKIPKKFNIADIDIRVKNQTIEKLVSGSNHSVILIGGKVFCRGDPEEFTVGRRINQRHKNQNSLTFDGVGLTNVVDVWCGGYHTIAKIKKGKRFVYFAWGANKRGQLGIGNYESQAYPIEIRKIRDRNIKQVAAGTYFTIFLTQEGEVYGCGQNDYGQLALGQGYSYIDSEDQKELEKELAQKMSLESQNQPVHQHQIESEQLQEKVVIQNNPENKQTQASDKIMQEKKVEEIQMKQNVDNNVLKKEEGMVEQSPAKQLSLKKKQEEKDLYIKTIKHIHIGQKINKIAAGSYFVMAWNEKQLYTWGMAQNYVLLNGDDDQDQLLPFKVKSKLINQHLIHQMAAGTQHVLYTSYPPNSQVLTLMSQEVKKASVEAKQRLSRRKK